MSQNYKVGDTVQLKSGGPVMTVTGVGDNYGTSSVWCSWFTDKGDEKSSTFPIEAVKLINL